MYDLLCPAGLRDDLREHLKAQPKPTAVVAPLVKDGEEGSSSSSSSESSSSSSSSSDSSSGQTAAAAVFPRRWDGSRPVERTLDRWGLKTSVYRYTEVDGGDYSLDSRGWCSFLTSVWIYYCSVCILSTLICPLQPEYLLSGTHIRTLFCLFSAAAHYQAEIT